MGPTFKSMNLCCENWL